MSTIKSSSEDLTLNADGSNEVKFQINAVENASINSSGLFTSTTIDATALTTVPVNKGGTGATTHTANNVLVGNGTSAIGSVAPGADGQVLTSTGSAWQSEAPAAGGALTFLSSQTASTSATINFESLITTAYTHYIFIVSEVRMTDDGATMNIIFGDASGYSTANYWYAGLGIDQDGTSRNINSASASALITSTAVDQVDTHSYSGVFYLHHPLEGGNSTYMNFHTVYRDNTAYDRMSMIGGGGYTQAFNVDKLRFEASSSTIMDGVFSMYGYNES